MIEPIQKSAWQVCSLKDKSCHGKVCKKAYRSANGIIKEASYCTHHRIFLGLLNRETIQHHHSKNISSCPGCKRTSRQIALKKEMKAVASMRFDDYD